MREPEIEKAKIDIGWGALLLVVPALPWIFGEAKAAGYCLLMLAGGLLLGHILTAAIDARNDRRAKTQQIRGPESFASAPGAEGVPALPQSRPARLTHPRLYPASRANSSADCV